MQLYLFTTLILLLVANVGSYQFLASTLVDHYSCYPLHYITPDAVSSYVVEGTEKAVWSSLLPVNQQDALAIFISEGISGFLGGVASKAIAAIDGNKNNRDSSLVNAETSGVYFGVSGALRSLLQIAGLSSILVNVLTVFFAGGVSALIKIRSRSIQPLIKRVEDGPTMYELMKFRDPSMLDLMKFYKNERQELDPRMAMMGPVADTEIASDLSKWFAIYFFSPSNPSNSVSNLEDAVLLGFIAGVFAQVIRENKDNELEKELSTEYKKRRSEAAKLRKAVDKNKASLSELRKKKLEVIEADIKLTKSRRFRYKISPKSPLKTSTSSNDIDETKNRNTNKNKPGQLTITTIFNHIESVLNGNNKAALKPMLSSSATDTRLPNTSNQVQLLEQNNRRFFPMPIRMIQRVGDVIEGRAQLVGEGENALLPPIKRLPDFAAARFLRSGFECAAQLLTYEAARNYVMSVSPYFQALQDPSTLTELLISP